MRYLLIGALAVACAVLGSFQAVKWGLHGETSLAWIALSVGAACLLAFIACIVLFLRGDTDDRRREAAARTPHPPVYGRPTAQDRPWLRWPTDA